MLQKGLASSNFQPSLAYRYLKQVRFAGQDQLSCAWRSLQCKFCLFSFGNYNSKRFSCPTRVQGTCILVLKRTGGGCACDGVDDSCIEVQLAVRGGNRALDPEHLPEGVFVAKSHLQHVRRITVNSRREPCMLVTTLPFSAIFAPSPTPGTPDDIRFQAYYSCKRSVQESDLNHVHTIVASREYVVACYRCTNPASQTHYANSLYDIVQHRHIHQRRAIERVSNERQKRCLDGGVKEAPRTRSTQTRSPDPHGGLQGCWHAPRWRVPCRLRPPAHRYNSGWCQATELQ